MQNIGTTNLSSKLSSFFEFQQFCTHNKYSNSDSFFYDLELEIKRVSLKVSSKEKKMIDVNGSDSLIKKNFRLYRTTQLHFIIRSEAIVFGKDLEPNHTHKCLHKIN